MHIRELNRKNSKIFKARQLLRNRTLRRIIKVYSKYFEYETTYFYSCEDEYLSKCQQREKAVYNILLELHSDLKHLKNKK